jgi:hypothetical protein
MAHIVPAWRRQAYVDYLGPIGVFRRQGEGGDSLLSREHHGFLGTEPPAGQLRG